MFPAKTRSVTRARTDRRGDRSRGSSAGLSSRTLRASLRTSIAEGAAAEVSAESAGGAVLTGWALFLRATPVVIGLLGALPLAAQIAQLPAAWLTQHVGPYRLAVAATGGSP